MSPFICSSLIPGRAPIIEAVTLGRVSSTQLRMQWGKCAWHVDQWPELWDLRRTRILGSLTVHSLRFTCCPSSLPSSSHLAFYTSGFAHVFPTEARQVMGMSKVGRAYREEGGGGGWVERALTWALSVGNSGQWLVCPFHPAFQGELVVKGVDAKRFHHKEKHFFFNLNELTDVN